MSTGLRKSLQGGIEPTACSNPGLELERYVKKISSGEANDEKTKLLNRVANSKPSLVYIKAFERWRGNLSELGALTAEMKVKERLLVGLSSESVLETAITLHPLYGMPIIPGDALKGLARHYFTQMTPPGEDREAHIDVLFGSQTSENGSAGHVRYFDAWFVPPGAPFGRDVLTVHHQAYYSSKGEDAAPTDFEDPVPVPYLSARGSFLFAVAGPTAAWSAMAQVLLVRALDEWGIGGKTSSGDGRFTRIDTPPVEIVGLWASPSAASSVSASGISIAAKSIIEGIDRLKPGEVKPRIGGYVDRLNKLTESEDRLIVAKALKKKLESTRLWDDKGLRSKTWMQELIAFLEQ